ncbi:MAG: hypothetical protein P1U58_14360 [Verrucomicrobiales bacterium]|nr:hypothetical protein [Verrucomicrobiales bacterium]
MKGERDGGQIRDQFTTCIANAKGAVKHVNLADSSGIESRIEAVERIFGAVSILRRVRGEEGCDVNELLEEELSSEVSRVKETFDSVFDSVVAGKGLDKADSPEELEEAIREMEDNFELKGSTENKEKAKAYTLLFSLSEIVEGVEAYRDAG